MSQLLVLWTVSPTGWLLATKCLLPELLSCSLRRSYCQLGAVLASMHGSTLLSSSACCREP